MSSSIAFFEIWGFPDVVASGIIAAFITLFGVGIQNYINTRLQKRQLEHDREQKNLERTMSMRRDIYLSGAEALGKMQLYLLSFGDPEKTPEMQSQILTGVNEALNKVAVVASIEIIEALSKVQSYYVQSLTTLMEKRTDLALALEHRANIENYIENLRQRAAQQLAILESLKNSKDERQRNSVILQYEKIDAELRIYNEELIKVTLQAVDQQTKLLRLSMEHSVEFDVFAAEANLRVRKELNFPLDEQKYLELIKQTGENNAVHIAKWYENFVEKRKPQL